MTTPRPLDVGRTRNSKRAVDHPPGCWARHDLCALSNARDIAIVRRDQAQGLAVRLADTLARTSRGDLAVDPDVLARDLMLARTVLMEKRS